MEMGATLVLKNQEMTIGQGVELCKFLPASLKVPHFTITFGQFYLPNLTTGNRKKCWV
uniref:B3 domain-containing protein At4g01580-like n=1 Tax=Rhizophora mucronata TaxID=61149 RepID=A0A2P2IW68_RHIMU